MIGGNKYSAAIVSASEEKIIVIIREEYQDPSQIGQLSFPPKGLKSLRPSATEKISRPELEYEEELPEESHDTDAEPASSED
jgi:hypothetical protein